MRKRRLVSLVKGRNRKENLKKALVLIKADLGDFKKAKTILLKPNLTSAYNSTANTTPKAVEAVLEFFQSYDPNFKQKKIIIAESSGEAFNKGEKMNKVYQRFGFEKIFKKYSNLVVGNLNKSKKFLEIPIETLSGQRKIKVAQEVFDFDYKISLTVPKTHDVVGVTLGIKNFLMGIIKQEDKSMMHGLLSAHSDYQRLKASQQILKKFAALIVQKAPWQFNLFLNNYVPPKLRDKLTDFNPKLYQQSVILLHQNLLSLGKKILPDLVVIDGFWGMEADGPVYGKKKKLGVAIVSTDPVKADAVGAKIMDFDPEKIAYLKLLAQNGKGELSVKGLVGEKIRSVAVNFTPHRHFELGMKVLAEL